jgi:citrate lyase subunit beta/citryl-CoA lyase
VVSETLRSLLFVPGDSQIKLIKGRQARADALVVDWEDAVAPEQKAQARSLTAEFLRAPDAPRQLTLVRFNPVSSRAFPEDCAALANCLADGIMLSKCRSAEDVRVLEKVLECVDPAERCDIFPLVESPAALLNAFSIASASRRVSALAFGAEDFSAEIGLVRSGNEIELLYARSALLTAARAAGRGAIDSPCLEFRNLAKVAAAARRARRLGFDGKMAIHPAQIDTINETFLPSESEMEQARSMLAAASSGAGVFAVGGSMVDEAILRRARRTVHLASRVQGKA